MTTRYTDPRLIPFWSDSTLDRIIPVARVLEQFPHAAIATDDPVLVRYLFKALGNVTVVVCERDELADARYEQAMALPPLYEAAPAAAIVGVTPRTVRNWITAGKITPHYAKRDHRLYVDLDEMKLARR